MMNHSHNDKRKYNPYSRLKFKNFGIKVWALTMLMLFGLQPISVKSQQYPVKLVPVVIPPYSMRLGDYATSTDNKLQLQVLMTDLMEPQHQTGIKFTLEAGLNAVPFARSNDFIVGMNPFMLYPGSNVTLTNVDLRALFELQNLGGINALQYAQPLSDGVYQFCFQAYDYYTKNNLSSKTCATVFLTQYDPPMLNLPQNAEKVQAMSPYAGGSGIVFQWMPRQIAPNTKYIFTLKELWDTGQSPISGFLSSPTLWQEETYAPTLYYGLDKTQLIPGKRYAWQVQAKSGNPVLGANPTEDNGVYKNNGFSEIYYFDYVENCTVPTLLMAKNVGRGRVEISWSLGGQPAGLYNVQYRKKNSNTEWMTQQSYQSPATLTGLEDLTEYEYRVGSVCGNIQDSGNNSGNAYSYSAIQYFTTDSKDNPNGNAQCGIMPAVDIANKNPLQTMLGVNEVFTAGDFPVTVLSAQGSNGIYSGTGYIQVPYLADTKVKVSFNNIMLNTDKKLIEGVIETTYDPNETAVNYASAGIGETFGDAGVKEVTINFPIGGITYSATPPPGKITITGSDGGGTGNGSTTEYPGGKDYTFTDSNGNIWTVDENGTVTQGGTVAQGGASTSTNTDGVTGSGNSATINQYTAKGVKIEWKENANGQFAYDTAEKTKLPKDKYPSVKDSENNTVYVPYKATVNKQTELFDAKVSITDPTLKDAKIIFKTLSIGKAIEATEINKTDTERNYQLKLIGSFDYAEEEVIAVLMPKDSTSKQKVISSFRLVHLSPKTVDVSLVPLDAGSQSKLQSQGDKLNQIYKKIGVTFNVTKDPVLDINSVVNGDTINSEDADLMSTYSPQQQQINSLYKGTGARYVLFVTDKKSSTGQRGYMRLNGQFGYVYNNAQDKTGAHELGHGVFKLEHPWKAYGTTQSATPLLMDYSTGEELSHLDWKQINDPAFKLYAFQGQSSGENIDTRFNFLMPNKAPFRFKNTDGKLATDVILVNTNNNGGNPNGTLYGFNLNGVEYAYKDGKFTSSTGTPYENQYLDKNRNELFRLVIQDTSDNCKYYLVNRNVADFNNPSLTPNNKSYNLCNKEKLPLGGNGDSNGNGTETREQTLNNLNDIVTNKLKEKFPEKEVKFTVLDKKDPLYQQKLDDALKQANYVLAIMDEEGKVQIKSSFKIPQWLADALPDLGKLPDENCSNEYINEGLTSLQNSVLYKNALRSEQIAMELGVVAYRGVFGTLYCMTDEKKFVNASPANQFVGGAMHEAIATFDVAQIVDGVISLVKSGAEEQIMSPINYYNNLKEITTNGFDTNDDVKFAKQVMGVVLLPPSNTAITGIEKGVKIAQNLKDHYLNCDNVCWYRYGQATVIIVPIILTAGEYAVAKLSTFAKLSPELCNSLLKLNEKLVAKGVVLEEQAGKTLIKNTEGTVLKEVESTKTADIEKALDDVMNGAGSLIDDVLSAALKSHPNFSKLGLTVAELDDFKVLLNTKMPNSASEIFTGLKSHLDAGTSFENMQQMISGLKNNWGNFSDGSKWVFNYTSSSKGLTQFGGKKLRFELPTETELGLRRIDIADVTNPNNPILYEFKSVQTPFNSTYATQFAKDLSSASGLDKIRWMFDGTKVSSLDKTKILDLIENVDIPQSTINKYFDDGLIHTKDELIDLIDGKFNDIFKVINL